MSNILYKKKVNFPTIGETFDELYYQFKALITEYEFINVINPAIFPKKKWTRIFDLAWKLSNMDKEKEIIQFILETLQTKCSMYLECITKTERMCQFILNNPIIDNKDVNNMICAIVVDVYYKDLHADYVNRVADLQKMCTIVHKYYIPNNKGDTFIIDRKESLKKYTILLDTFVNMANKMWEDIVIKI